MGVGICVIFIGAGRPWFASCFE